MAVNVGREAGVQPPNIPAPTSLVTKLPGGMGGIVLPAGAIPTDIQIPSVPTFDTVVANMAAIAPPPRASNGGTTFKAEISAAPKSVAEVVYNVTPVSGIQNLVSEIRDTRPRPALPPGWQGRVYETLPKGLTERVVAWGRSWPHRLRPRSNVSIPVDRE